MNDDSWATELWLAAFRLNRCLHSSQVNSTSCAAVHYSGVRPGARLTLRQLSALSTLDVDGPMTPGSLAAHEGVTHASMTRVIASLDVLGLLHRVPDPTDGRQTILAATDAGAVYVRDEVHAPEDWLDHRLAGIDEADYQTLVAALPLLDRLIDAPPRPP